MPQPTATAGEPIASDGLTPSTWWPKTHNNWRVAERMWDTWREEHRGMLCELLTALPPFTSLYEVGCGSGPNLRLLQLQQPELRLGGGDSCRVMAQYATHHLGIPIDHATLPQEAPTGSWDLVLSFYSLAYISVRSVIETLGRMRDGCVKALFLVEPTAHVAPHEEQGWLWSGPNGLKVPDAVHDYDRMLAMTGWKPTLRWQIVPQILHVNAATYCERA